MKPVWRTPARRGLVMPPDPPSVLAALPYTAAPVLAAALGAGLVAWRPPGERTQGFVQHFAAGVVFAAAAAELLPDLLHRPSLVAVLAGAAAGLMLMLAIRAAGRRLTGGVALAAVIGIDVLVDGLVVGLGFIHGVRQGLLLTIALTVELLFLAVSVAAELGGSGMPKLLVAATTIGLSLLLPAAAAIGLGVVSSLADPLVTALYGFGLVALLYLVTEELLVEAHNKSDPPLATAMFFVGFFMMVSLDRVIV